VTSDLKDSIQLRDITDLLHVSLIPHGG
jgi:hypothetical protein